MSLGIQFDQIGTVPSGQTLQGQINSLKWVFKNAVTKTVNSGYFTLTQTDCPGMTAGKALVCGFYSTDAKHNDYIYTVATGATGNTTVYVRTISNGSVVNPADNTAVRVNVWYPIT